MIKRPLLIISCLFQIIFRALEMIFRVFQINFHDLQVYFGSFAGLAAARFRSCETAPRIVQITLPLRYIHHHGLVAVSKKPTPLPMPHIESPRHRVLEPLHALHQIRLGRLNTQ
jgi:hypothetical protein